MQKYEKHCAGGKSAPQGMWVRLSAAASAALQKPASYRLEAPQRQEHNEKYKAESTTYNVKLKTLVLELEMSQYLKSKYYSCRGPEFGSQCPC